MDAPVSVLIDLDFRDIGFLFVVEIYRIVSQKQIHDSPDDVRSPSNNVQTITVAPTDSSDDRRKSGCCN